MRKWNQKTRFQLIFDAMFYSEFRCIIFFSFPHLFISEIFSCIYVSTVFVRVSFRYRMGKKVDTRRTENVLMRMKGKKSCNSKQSKNETHKDTFGFYFDSTFVPKRVSVFLGACTADKHKWESKLLLSGSLDCRESAIYIFGNFIHDAISRHQPSYGKIN